MTDPFSLRSESSCLSRLALDRLLADEHEDLASARAHLTGCARCSGRLEQLKAEQRALLTDDHVRRRVAALAAAAEQTARPGFWERVRRPLLGLATAAAAAGVLVVAFPRSGDDAVRLKGAPSFEVLLVEGERARALGSGERLAPGAALVFRAGCEQGCELLVVGLDEAGPAYVLEAERAAPWPLPAGAPSTLPVRADLDQTQGDERFIALFCSRAPGRSEVLARVEQAYARGSDGRRRLTAEPPEVAGCTVRSRLVHRQGAP